MATTQQKGKRKDKALTGDAGAHYLAFRLAAMGYAVGLTTHGTRSIDLVVANPDTGKSITVQTKTMRTALRRSGTESWRSWRVGIRRLQPCDTFFYTFVDLKDDPSQTPEVFIVPSVRLSPLLYEYKKGERVVDVWCAIDDKDAPNYRNNWDIIKNALA